MGKSQTVPVVDNETIINDLYDPESIKEKIRAKRVEKGLSVEGDLINHCYLYRKNSAGEWEQLQDYNDIPSSMEIRDAWGGGKFRVISTYDDPNAKGGRGMDTAYFTLAGPSKTIWDNPAPVSGPEPSKAFDFDKQLGELMQLAKVKMLMGGEENKSADKNTEMIMKSMEAMNAANMKMFEIIMAKNENPISKELMEGLFKKNSADDMDRFMKFYSIIQKGGGATEAESSWLKELAPVLGPLAMKFLGGGNTPAPMAGTPAAQQNGAQNPVQAILNAIQGIGNQLNSVMSRLTALEEAVFEPEPGNEQLPLNDSSSPVIGDYTQNAAADLNSNNSNQEENQMMQFFENKQREMAGELRAADDATKLAELKKYIENPSIGVAKTFEWCAKYGAFIATDEPGQIAEFNKYLKMGGYPEFIPGKKNE